MKDQQLMLFPEEQRALKEAMQTLQTCGVKHRHFNHFVNGLASAFRAARPGAAIVAACSCEQGMDEVLAEFSDRILTSHRNAGAGADAFMPLEVRVPCGLSPKAVQQELFDRYRAALNSFCIRHAGQPRFQWDSGIVARTETGQLVELLRCKAPSLVIMRDMQNLATAYHTPHEVRSAWMQLRDIAALSGITHLYCGPVSEVLETLEFPCVRDRVDAFALRPYDLRDKAEGGIQKLTFQGYLNDLDTVLPWADDRRLLPNLEYINARVWGDPDRLRRWVLRALVHATADGATSLRWEDFCAAHPDWAQVERARNEFELAKKFYAPGGSPEDAAATDVARLPQKGANRRPGFRKDSRDSMAA